MDTIFKPMLADDAVLDKLRFPLLASPKLDGIRAIPRNGVVYSRRNKPIPNPHVQERFRHLDHWDGELIYGSPTSPSCYRDTSSAVMGSDTNGLQVHFYVFDHVKSPHLPYHQRSAQLQPEGDFVRVLEQHLIPNVDQLLTLEAALVEQGYEGLILRDPNAPYKNGRSTVREGYLLKLKRFIDAEAMVVGFEERMHNGNEAKINEVGKTHRSSHQVNKSGRGDLGSLLLDFNGIPCSVGTGFTDEERAEIWASRDKYLGKLAKIKYFPVGVKVAPRHPVFLGWRSEMDM